MNTIYSFSIFDLFPYLFLLFAAFVISHNQVSEEVKGKRLYLLLLIFSCIRYGIGFDYFSYLNLIESGRTDYTFFRIEPLGRLLIMLARETHPQVFFAVASAITLYPIYYASRKFSLSPYMSIVLYMLHPMLFLSGLGVIRNAVGYSLVLMGFFVFLEYKNKKGKLVALLFLAFAYGFHSSSIIGILLFPLYYFFNGKKINILIYLSSFALSMVVTYVLSSLQSSSDIFGRAADYAFDREHSGGGLMTLIVNGLNIINLLFWGKIKNTDNYTNTFLKFVNFGTFVWNVLLPLDVVLASRAATFFLIFEILLLPAYVIYNYNFKKLIYAFFICYFASSFILSINGFLKNHDDMANIPYQVFFYHNNYSNLH